MSKITIDKIDDEIEVASAHGRFKDAPWFIHGSQDIIIVGAGGTGSWFSLFAARANHKLYIYDHDSYDLTNIAGQWCKLKDVGNAKNKALLDNLNMFCDLEHKPELYGKYDEDSMVCPIMISCLDNMATRKLMFDKWKTQDDRLIFIDGRQGPENRDVFCVLRGDESKYEDELFDDSEVMPAPCTYKATSHTGAGTAEVMIGMLNNFLSNVHYGNQEGLDYMPIRELPFSVKDNLVMLSREYEYRI